MLCVGASHNKLLTCQVSSHKHCGGKDMFLICQGVSKNHMSQKPCDFIGRSLLREVTRLPSKVVIDTMVVEIY